MRIGESYIFLREVRFHARHGVMPQERVVGADFSLSLRAEVDFADAVAHDNLDGTLDYAALYEVVRKEMEQPSQLVEHVAGRIGYAVFSAFPQVRTLDIRLTKLNPPMGADCAGAGVELHLINDKTGA